MKVLERLKKLAAKYLQVSQRGCSFLAGLLIKFEARTPHETIKLSGFRVCAAVRRFFCCLCTGRLLGCVGGSRPLLDLCFAFSTTSLPLAVVGPPCFLSFLLPFWKSSPTPAVQSNGKWEWLRREGLNVRSQRRRRLEMKVFSPHPSCIRLR